MTTSVFPAQGGAVDNTKAAVFIPEIWSDEIVAAYKRTLVLANLVSKMPMSGKKGDTIHVPKPTRGAVTAKAAGVAVTIQGDVEDEVVININRHFEYSRFIEDITATQALTSMRQFYTNDAGYALAKNTDNDLHNLGTALGDGTLDLAPDGTGADWVNTAVFYANAGAALSAYAVDTVTAGDDFTDIIFRDLIQKMDDADVPMDGRSFVVPPSLRNAIMGIDRYVSSDFVNGQGVSTGKIGELYGVDIFVSSNCPVVETAAANSADTVDNRAASLIHKDTYVHAEQMSVRSQTQYKQEFLSNLYTSDTIYGVQVMRPDAGFVLVVRN
jgi:N4-gp56 family major capsid protein